MPKTLGIIKDLGHDQNPQNRQGSGAPCTKPQELRGHCRFGDKKRALEVTGSARCPLMGCGWAGIRAGPLYRCMRTASGDVAQGRSSTPGAPHLPSEAGRSGSVKNTHPPEPFGGGIKPIERSSNLLCEKASEKIPHQINVLREPGLDKNPR